MSSPSHTAYLPNVRAQYEDYPYPYRNPQDERKYLFSINADCLDRITHFCFEGKRDLRKSSRILIAGGGTGDATIFLAEQLRHTDAEIVYLDISEASMKIAKERAAIRGLKNIRWLHHSILEIPSLNLGQFDYINCYGVLHHLANPSEGLRALKHVLHPNGAMCLMVYGFYGRQGVYQMQTAMKLIAPNDSSMQQKVDYCKSILANLPKKNHYNFLAPIYQKELDHAGDIAIYDLFLHTQDRAYTVPQLYEWLEQENLNLLHFNGEQGMSGLRDLVYEPLRFIKDPHLRAVVQNYDKKRQQAIAEVLNGGIRKHDFYVGHTPRQAANLADREMIPHFAITLGKNYFRTLLKSVKETPVGTTIGIGFESAPYDKLEFKISAHLPFFVELFDSKHTIGDIIEYAKFKSSQPNITEDVLEKELLQYVRLFTQYHMMYLHHHSIPRYTDCADIQKLNK